VRFFAPLRMTKVAARGRSCLTIRHRNSEQTGPRRDWLQLRPSRGRGREKKISRAHSSFIRLDRAAEANEESESASTGGCPRAFKVPFFHREMGALNELLADRADEFWLDILEVDRLHRLREVQLARVASCLGPVPVEDAIGRIAILLNFDEQVSSTDGMKAAARDKKGVACFHLETMH
jgi:hypothetical protein